jgi:hypothetical protein
MAVVAGLGELVGGLLFAAGLLTPLAALILTVVMLNAIFTVHWSKGFFNSAGELGRWLRVQPRHRDNRTGDRCNRARPLLARPRARLV